MSVVIAALENIPLAQKVLILETIFKSAKDNYKQEQQTDTSIKPSKKAKAEKKEKGEKAEKDPKDPDAPSKESNWWIKGTSFIMTRLQALFPENLADLKKPIIRTNIPKLLKERAQLTKDIQPTDDQVKAAYNDWVNDPSIQKRYEEERNTKKAEKPKKVESETSEQVTATTEKPKKPRKKTNKVSDQVPEPVSAPSSPALPSVEEGYGLIEGVKYRLVDGTLDSGCFVYIGDECKGFYFNGAIDAEIQP